MPLFYTARSDHRKVSRLMIIVPQEKDHQDGPFVLICALIQVQFSGAG
jgi:hypothetical protein